MKKLLLLLGVALSMPFATKALEYVPLENPNPEIFDRNITPSFYNFNDFKESDVDKLVSAGSIGNTATAITGQWLRNQDFAFDKGLLIYGGNIAYKDNSVIAEYKKGVQTYDFGGEVGNVLVLNGANSNINNYLPEGSKQLTPSGKALSTETGNPTLLFWITNYTASKEYSAERSGSNDAPRYRMRVELNIFSNNQSSNAAVFNSMFVVGDAGTNHGPSSTTTAVSVAPSEFSTTDGKWDPTKWMVYEFNYGHPAGAAPALRMQIPINGLFDNSTVFIRNIQIYNASENLTDSSEEYIETVNKPYNTYKHADYYTTVSNITLEHNQGEEILHLSAGEEAELSFTYEKKNPDKDLEVAEFVPYIEKNDNISILSESYDADKMTFKVKVNDNVSKKNEVKVSVKHGDAVTSNEVSICHYAAPQEVSIMNYWDGNEGYSFGNSTIQVLLGTDNKNNTIRPFIHSTEDITKKNVDAYQDFTYQLFRWTRDNDNIKVPGDVIDVADQTIINVNKDVDEEGNILVFSQQGKGVTSDDYSLGIRITPLKAGEAKSFANEGLMTTALDENGSHVYQLAVLANSSLSGIENVAVDASNEEGELFNLQGVRVVDAAPGIYIRRANGTATKVVIK